LRRVLAVVGDLNSRSGYSKAIELYTNALCEKFDVVVGLDIHQHPQTYYPRFKFPIISTGELKALAQDSSLKVLVLNVTTPNHFLRLAGAVNVGCFFWETDHIPESWMPDLRAMNEIWSPMRFLIPALKTFLPNTPVFEFPCPIVVEEQTSTTDSNREIFFSSLEAKVAPQPGKERWAISDIKKYFKTTHLVISSNVGRKGLPILFHDWISEFGGNDHDALVLKISSANINKSALELFGDVKQQINTFCERFGRRQSNIFLTTEKYSEAQMTSLMKHADLYLSTSLGEGMGLGVFESLWLGTPVICPKHTTFADYLPGNYPFFMGCDYKNAAFHDEFGIYPISSRWGILHDHEISRTVEKLRSTNSSGETANIMRETRRHVENYLNQKLMAIKTHLAEVMP
jgi:glycosyltransferase involved in cell wall biosynthesis